MQLIDTEVASILTRVQQKCDDKEKVWNEEKKKLEQQNDNLQKQLTDLDIENKKLQLKSMNFKAW